MNQLLHMAQSVAVFRSMYIKHSRNIVREGSWRFLVLIGNYDGGRGMRSADIAAYFRCSKAYVSKMIKELALEGLICDRPDESDARSRFLVCSEKGRVALREIMDEYVSITKKLYDGLGPRKSRLFIELLDQAIAILEKHSTDDSDGKIS